MKSYADLGSLTEDERIQVIAQAATTRMVGFFVEDAEKAERYIAKLLSLNPGVRVFDRQTLQVTDPGTGEQVPSVLVRIGPASWPGPQVH